MPRIRKHTSHPATYQNPCHDCRHYHPYQYNATPRNETALLRFLLLLSVITNVVQAIYLLQK